MLINKNTRLLRRAIKLNNRVNGLSYSASDNRATIRKVASMGSNELLQYCNDLRAID